MLFDVYLDVIIGTAIWKGDEKEGYSETNISLRPVGKGVVQRDLAVAQLTAPVTHKTVVALDAGYIIEYLMMHDRDEEGMQLDLNSGSRGFT